MYLAGENDPACQIKLKYYTTNIAAQLHQRERPLIPDNKEMQSLTMWSLGVCNDSHLNPMTVI